MSSAPTNNATAATAGDADKAAAAAFLATLSKEDLSSFLQHLHHNHPNTDDSKPAATDAAPPNSNTAAAANAQSGLLHQQQLTQQANLQDLSNQAALLSTNTHLSNLVGRPSVYIHCSIDPTKANGTTIPIAQIKSIVANLLAANLPTTPVDILHCDAFQTPHQAKNGRPRAYIRISPVSCANYNNTSFTYPAQDFANIEAFLSSLYSNQQRSNLSAIPSLITEGAISFFSEAVNATYQKTIGVISGVTPRIVQTDPSVNTTKTLQALGLRLYNAARAASERSGKKAPGILQCENPHLIKSAISVKILRTKNDSQTNFLSVAVSTNCAALATALSEAFTDGENGLSSFTFNPQPPSAGIPSTPPLRAHFASFAPGKSNEKLLNTVSQDSKAAMNSIIIIHGINMSNNVLSSDHIPHQLVSALPNCKAIIPHFRHDSTTTFTFCFQTSFETKQYNTASVQFIISTIPAFQPYLPSVPSPPSKPAVKSSLAAASTSSISSSSANSPFLRLQTSLLHQTTHQKIYALINGKGGGALIGVYDCTYDDLRPFIDGVSHHRVRRVSSKEEGYKILSSYYPGVDTPEAAAAYRNNTPLDETNVTNRSTTVQRTIITPNLSSSKANLNEFTWCPSDAENHHLRSAATSAQPISRKRNSAPSTQHPSPQSPSTASPNPDAPVHTVQAATDDMSIISEATCQINLSSQQPPKKSRPSNQSPSSTPLNSDPQMATIRLSVNASNTTTQVTDMVTSLLLATKYANAKPTSAVLRASVANHPHGQWAYLTYPDVPTALKVYSTLFANPATTDNQLAPTLVPNLPNLSSAQPLSLLYEPYPAPHNDAPTRCPCKGCEFSSDINTDYFNGSAAAYQHHINHFHSMIFRQLDRNKLHEYSTDICTGCKQLFHPDVLSSHISSCPNMRLSQNTDTSPASQISINSSPPSNQTPAVTPAEISRIRNIVPAGYQTAFDTLLQDTTITHQQLRNHVMDWIVDSNVSP